MCCLWLMRLSCHYGFINIPWRTRKLHRKPFWVSMNPRNFGPLFMSWLMPSGSPVGLIVVPNLWKNLHTLPHTHTHAHWWKVHGSWIVPQYMSWCGFQEECGLFQKSGQKLKLEVNCCSPRSPVWVWHSSHCWARSAISSRLGFERVEKGCFTLEALQKMPWHILSSWPPVQVM